MIELLESLQNTIKPHKICSRDERHVNIGNSCVFLHQNITVYLLFGCFLLVSSQQHFGNPIQCLVDNYQEEQTIPENVINNYCFMATTYSVVNDFSVDPGVYPGIRPETGDENSIRRHAYYQWVPLLLLIQAVIFMIPHWFWEKCEGGYVANLVTNLTADLEPRLVNRKDRKVNHKDRKVIHKDRKVVRKVAKVFYSRLGRQNRMLGIMWILCDVLALLNVLANFYLTDVMFNGMFFKFGIESLKMMGSESMHSPVFPLLTKCSFSTYGSSGSLQNFDSLCVMTLNVVNEKVYIILWIWFFVLTCLTVVLILSKFVRILLMNYGSMSYYESTIGVPTKISGNELRKCTMSMTFGDCVLFHILAKNMRPMTYQRFVEYLLCEIETIKNDKFL